MSAHGATACARPSCGKIVTPAKAYYRNGLPYCTKFCFDREAAAPPAETFDLQEKRP